MPANEIQLPSGKLLGLSRDHQRYILGGLFFLMGLFFLLSVLFARPDQTLFGSLGAAVQQAFVLFFGQIAAFVFPLLLLYWSFRAIQRNDITIDRLMVKMAAIFVFIITFCAVLTLPLCYQPDSKKKCLELGGMLGNFITSDSGLMIPRYIGVVGSALLFSLFMIPALLVATDMLFYPFFKFSAVKIKSWNEKRMERKASRPKIEKPPRKEKKPFFKKKKPEPQPDKKIKDKSEDVDDDDELEIITMQDNSKKIKKEKGAAHDEASAFKGYTLPPLSLLDDPPPSKSTLSEDEIKEKCEILEKTLDNFGIEAKVVQVTQGPVVTLFALKPAAGVKINRIVNLENDLAMALRAIKVRIQAPIPGKDAVGIEVPNRKVAGVYLKEILTCEKMKRSGASLMFGLGKTIAGDPHVGNLEKMPHLLIAGATGSGKSVCLNAIIASILFRQPPDRVKFILIDPKRVEMSVYQAIPHLMAPVVCETRKAAGALAWAVEHMEQRYRVLAEIGVRNIGSYNSLALSKKPHKKLMGKEVKYMPHIVIVIDELADLMMIAKNAVEEYVIRLAQLSRAVGIHLVLATQRPSVNVITGIIKANFPSRIAFQVSSKVDSRTILDSNGAETLLGRGDMLFSHPGAPKPVRIQGAFVSEEEMERLTDYIKDQAKAIYVKEDFDEIEIKKGKVVSKSDSSSSSSSSGSGGSPGDDETDEDLYTRALRLILENKKASVSLIQRRLRIGYARAGRLMDMMEDAGIVGPYQGSKPRDLLVDPGEEIMKLDRGNPTMPGAEEEEEESQPEENSTEEPEEE